MAQSKPKRGPNGPISSAGGKSGTNRPTPHRSAGVSGNSHSRDLTGGGGKKR